MKILNVQWFTSSEGCIGIVTIHNGYKVVSYMKQVYGYDEKQDIADIISTGAKIYVGQLQQIVDCYEKENKQ